jgi:hypothetical protein
MHWAKMNPYTVTCLIHFTANLMKAGNHARLETRSFSYFLRKLLKLLSYH